MGIHILRLQQLLGRESHVGLINHEEGIGMRVHYAQQLPTVNQFAIRIVGVTKPAEVLSLQRDIRQILLRREKGERMLMQATGILILRERGHGDGRFRTTPSLRNQVEGRDRAIRHQDILLFHLMPTSQ